MHLPEIKGFCLKETTVFDRTTLKITWPGIFLKYLLICAVESNGGVGDQNFSKRGGTNPSEDFIFHHNFKKKTT